MKREVAIKLKETASEIERIFSDPTRKFNTLKETYTLDKIEILSEYTAALIFKKNTGKKALVFAYHTMAAEGKWQYFFPKESHTVGMEKVSKLLNEVEQFNYSFNLKDIPQQQKSEPVKEEVEIDIDNLPF
jgi:hypothetical protein